MRDPKKKTSCQIENPKRQSRQKLGPKKKKKRKARQAENPKVRSRQKLGPKKKKKRKENPARLKTQKGGLDKSQGQRKEEEEEEEEEKKKRKIPPSWKLEDAT